MITSNAVQSPVVPEIGRYRLVAELARGGMGNVYLAAAQGPGDFSKLVVVKELKPELSVDETYVAMFLDEARLAARLNHPNIVQTNEVGSDGNRHYLVMEFLDGRSLHRIGKRLGGRFPLAAHLRAIAESLLGLHHAHEMRDFDGEPLGVVHRDVSPLNLLVTFDGQAKVVDFGIAKAVGSSHQTKMGVIKGRVAYMAPEQAKGGKVDRRADIYSAGVMLWEAAARRRLWPGHTEVEILNELSREGPRPLRSVCPDAPEELNRICARAMASDPDQRYATAAELLSDLEEHLGHRDDAMSMRDVGALISEAFADERERLNAVIDDALARARDAPPSGVMRTFRAQPSGISADVHVSSERAPKSAVRRSTPALAFAPSGGASSLANLSRSAPFAGATLNSMQPRRPGAVGSSKHAWFVAAGAGALLLGALFGGGVAIRERQSAGSPVTVRPQLAPMAAQKDPEPVELGVRVTPLSAEITIDGARVVGNPYHARYPRDGLMHHVVASAEGYESKTEDVSFATDVSIDVSLSRRVSAPQAQSISASNSALAHAPVVRRAAAGTTPVGTNLVKPEAPPVPPPTAARTDIGGIGSIGTTSGRTPLRPISTNNPYENP